MKILQKIWDEFVYGGHLLSLGASGMVWSILIIKNIEINLLLLFIAYLVAQIIYIYNHYQEAETDLLTNPERTIYLQKSKKKLPLLISLYCFALFLSLIYTNINTWIFIALVILSGILYTTIFKSFTTKIVGFKNFYVAFFWSMSALLPLFYYSLTFDLFFMLFLIFIFLRWIINTTYFDIKDIESDKLQNLKNIPCVFGRDKTLRYLKIVNFISVVPIIVGAYIGVMPTFTVILSFPLFYSYFYLKLSKRMSSQNIRAVSYYLVDAEYIFWPLMLLISKIIIK